MNIVILGAGTVGGTLAETLVGEQHNITIVDQDISRLNELKDRLDLAVVHGHAAHPDVLRSANCLDADMLIAVTNEDETNMIACQVAYTVFNTPTKIARIRSESFSTHKELFADEAIPIDVIIVPEQLVSDAVSQLIDYPGARQVVDFVDGKLNLITIRVSKDAPLLNNSLSSFYKLFSNQDVKILAVYKNKNKNKVQLINSMVFDAGDEIIVLCKSDLTPKIIQQMQTQVDSYKSIIIAGGGHIGYTLAKNLETKYKIKIIDPGDTRVNYLAEKLDYALVLKGDAADKELLIDENIDNTDLFCAVTNNDGINIMSSLLAKRLGARKVIALITRGTYSELISGSDIDAAISPQYVTVSALLRHIRRGDIVKAHSMREGTIEAIELVVHGDEASTQVINRKVRDLKMPKSTSISAIIREEEILLNIDDETILENDHVIIFLSDKKLIPSVEKLFQIAPTFI